MTRLLITGSRDWTDEAPSSRGTWDMVQRLRAAGVPVEIVNAAKEPSKP